MNATPANGGAATQAVPLSNTGLALLTAATNLTVNPASIVHSEQATLTATVTSPVGTPVGIRG